ncbi:MULTISPECIES: sodium:proton antiporter [unclassified Mycolicibacterium]|uniref:sodium:proton antiporter n=1 Tax=unclassified Mycolicibacterium TaxID=2636767 RepID=UPI002EDA7892
MLASNIGGAATPIGDPPNIIIGSRAGLTFNDFLVHMAPAVAIIFALFVVFTPVLFRKDLRAEEIHIDEVMALQERRAIKDTRLLVRAGGAEPGHPRLRAAFGTARGTVGRGPARGRVMLLVTDIDVAEILPEVEWPTLVFFMGLFVMVAGLVHTGVIGKLGSVGESAFVDNIPYTATITPIVESMVAQTPDAGTGQALWWAFAFGACFSGNGTAIAASGNVVALGIAPRAGHRSVSGASPAMASL